MSDGGGQGRPQEPIDPASPNAVLAAELRRLAEEAGDPSYRELAASSGVATSTVSRVLSGKQAPTWPFVESFLRAVKADKATVRAWRERFEPGEAPRPARPLDWARPIFYLGFGGGSRDAALRVYGDLTDLVNALVGPTPGRDVGFLPDAPLGRAFWADSVRAAIGTCHVYVPMLSPSYLRSPWCRAEWEIFSARPATGRSAVLPVQWTPLFGAELPKEIDRVQRFVPSPAPAATMAQYQQEGLLGLMTLGLPDYRVVLWRLALQIVRLAHEVEVEPRVPGPDVHPGPAFLD